jgi:hypothetical protein
MADIHYDNDSVYSDTVIVVLKKKSTSLHSQIHNHKIQQTEDAWIKNTVKKPKNSKNKNHSVQDI